MRLHLIGKNAHRTPFAYPAYRAVAGPRIEIVADPADADVLLFAYVLNIHETADTVAALLEADPGKRLVVMSEEPLWDSTNSGAFHRPVNTAAFGKARHVFSYAQINHTTSDAFRFELIPYYLTTHDEFALRYGALLESQAARGPRGPGDWTGRPIDTAFFAERRMLRQKYDVDFPERGLRGLSVYRSEVAELFDGSRDLRVGRGWEQDDAPPRQALPDWHLDKLARLRGAARVVSGLENTCQAWYVTEKLFDAFACGAIPLYWVPPGSDWIDRLVPPESYLNLHGLSPEEAAQAIRDFAPDAAYAEAWRAAVAGLAERFACLDDLLDQRRLFADRFLAALDGAVAALAAGAPEADGEAEADSDGEAADAAGGAEDTDAAAAVSGDGANATASAGAP